MNTLRNLFINSSKTTRRNYLIAMMIFFVVAYVFMPYTGYTQSTEQTVAQESFHPFALFGSESNFKPIEIYGLLTVLAIAIAGLLYALMLVKQVRKADQGTKKMQEIAAAVREGSNAYLAAQFKKIGPLIIIITLFLYFTYTGTIDAFRWGRSGAFLVGSIFSFLVGFVGMRLAASADIEKDEASLVCTWGETNGGLSLVWVSYVRINLDAGASVFGRAQ